MQLWDLTWARHLMLKNVEHLSWSPFHVLWEPSPRIWLNFPTKHKGKCNYCHHFPRKKTWNLEAKLASWVGEASNCTGPMFRGLTPVLILCCHYLEIINNFLIYWFFRERERERREKHWFVVSLIYAFIDCFLYVSWQGIELATLVCWDDTLTNWATWPGSIIFFKQGVPHFHFALGPRNYAVYPS